MLGLCVGREGLGGWSKGWAGNDVCLRVSMRKEKGMGRGTEGREDKLWSI